METTEKILNAKIEWLDAVIDCRRLKVNTLRDMRAAHIQLLEDHNRLLKGMNLGLQFDTAATHPSYEVSLIDQHISIQSNEMNEKIRERISVEKELADLKKKLDSAE